MIFGREQRSVGARDMFVLGLHGSRRDVRLARGGLLLRRGLRGCAASAAVETDPCVMLVVLLTMVWL